MDFPRQVAATVRLGLSSLPTRLGASLVIVIGMASRPWARWSLVLSLSTGFVRAATGAGRADRAVILSQGALLESGSSLSRTEVAAVVDAPGVRRSPDGRPLVSADILATVMLSQED